jgi:2-polyprenyl-3-methyl-5-hydroxy-6-metoxy-1,4-benzoquinol methylase
MNRQQRRAAQRQQKRTPAPKPDDAQSLNALACALLQQGRLHEAAEHFARALLLMPELFDQYPAVVATLLNVNPAVGAGVERVARGWPAELRAGDVLGPDGLVPVAGDPLLRCMLESATVRDLALERYLTSLRRIILEMASGPAAAACDGSTLAFACALARQCFINEYVFAASSEEAANAGRLKDTLLAALPSGRAIPPLMVAVVAAYFPLAGLPGSDSLCKRAWPRALRGLLEQQIIEPEQELQLREQIARLTPIENKVSLAVKEQYEENPYPRWALAPSNRGPVHVSTYLRRQFPAASFRDLAADRSVDVLVAGCGTGQQAIVTARLFANTRVLAVDLSLASLAYALRMLRALSVRNLEYAQADLLELPSLGRSFDVIEASGVLHHLAEPMTGWRALVSMLRPGGLMHIGLYSRSAREQIRAARAYFAGEERHPTASEIRRCRRKLLDTPMKSVASYADYFSISECRDLLFHVQEHQLTLAEIAAFLREHNLNFLGFELAPQTHANYRLRFPHDHAMTDLKAWEAFEAQHPATFAAMYQFWIQRP